MIQAVLSGDAAQVEARLAQDDPNVAGVHGRTALMHAASLGARDLAELLLAKGAQLDQEDHSGNTALFFFPAQDDPAVVELLVGRGAQVNHRNRAGWTPLVGAAMLGHADTVRLLIDEGAEIEEVPAALIQAALKNRPQTAELLLAAGASPNPALRDGRPLFHHVADKGWLPVLRLLLAHGVEGDQAAGKESCCPGQTPLMAAAAKGHSDVVKTLLERGANPDRWNGEGWTPLHLAAREGHVDSVLHLLSAGASVDVAGREESRAVPLLIAVTGGLTETAQALLDHGADPNSRNRHQVTPLMAAAYRGHPQLARLLLERGADLEAVNQDGNTALLMAVFRRHPEVVKLLSEEGARVDLEARIKGFGTVAPLMLAAGRGDHEIAETLLRHGAPVDVINEMDDLGRLTPLMMAAWKGDEKMVELLLKHGADSQLTLQEGRTAADWAREGEHPEVEALLREGSERDKISESSG
ncbi:MAG TPA: ankyrin repeat domain-containing protein [Acidobacteriota bacterium]|nr:ankyrin repeat domain-containing protein [Acidobacteriota bacterium]